MSKHQEDSRTGICFCGGRATADSMALKWPHLADLIFCHSACFLAIPEHIQWYQKAKDSTSVRTRHSLLWAPLILSQATPSALLQCLLLGAALPADPSCAAFPWPLVPERCCLSLHSQQPAEPTHRRSLINTPHYIPSA